MSRSSNFYSHSSLTLKQNKLESLSLASYIRASLIMAVGFEFVKFLISSNWKIMYLGGHLAIVVPLMRPPSWWSQPWKWYEHNSNNYHEFDKLRNSINTDIAYLSSLTLVKNKLECLYLASYIRASLIMAVGYEFVKCWSSSDSKIVYSGFIYLGLAIVASLLRLPQCSNTLAYLNAVYNESTTMASFLPN